MPHLFEGPFYSYLLSTAPLQSAIYHKHGSSTSLFTKEGRLYRLTRQGCGHSFIARESAFGNPSVTHLIHDFGPVAPSDEDEGEHYWLAEVEWLEDLDIADPSTQALQALLDELTHGESQLHGDDLEQFGLACMAAAGEHASLSHLLTTLANMAAFAMAHEAEADIKLDNIMLRPSTHEFVLADPICDQYFPLDPVQHVAMASIRTKVLDAK